MIQFYLPTHYLKKTAFLLLFVGLAVQSFGKEGMWLPPTLKQRAADMKSMGLQIPVEKIYNEDGTGLNNAVVLFGRGCTGEIISSKGLLLTNHHCAYGTVQGLSSKEKDYFANGFWAMNEGEELPCPGLTVTFIRKMENVSDKVLYDLPDTLKEHTRDSIIAARISGLEKGYRYLSNMDAAIKPYFNGNQYWVILSETYTDIRLAGFPPNGIGQFGGDTDNWMWPRHTGDFSVFRVYAGKDNKPAPYSANNKPYKSDVFFPINISGYNEGDFTMVYGFPGTTQEYISSYQLEQIYNIIDPIRIDVRTKKLEVWNEQMDADREVFLKYTSKKASVSNGWKKWQGELRGLRLNDVVGKKRAAEREFQQWAAQEQDLSYARELLASLQVTTRAADSALKAAIYIQEAVFGIELIQQASMLERMLRVMRSGLSQQGLEDSLQKLGKGMDGFYKNYDPATDRKLFAALMPVYFQNGGDWVPAGYRRMFDEYGGNFHTWSNNVYNLSLLADRSKLQAFLSQVTVKDSNRIKNDPAWKLYDLVARFRDDKVTPVIKHYQDQLSYYNRLYMKAQMKKDWNTMFYPDANLTLRLTYGRVEGMDPDGPADYSFQTNLDQAIAKDNPEVKEFDVPEKLKVIHRNKDFGRWASNGTVPLAFIASNHTSGGNSGSPVLNSRGELIGTNFDRVWEGTMSDLYFDPRLCRNISVDIRYTLFIIEKFGGAGWLLKEMKLVK